MLKTLVEKEINKILGLGGFEGHLEAALSLSHSESLTVFYDQIHFLERAQALESERFCSNLRFATYYLGHNWQVK